MDWHKLYFGKIHREEINAYTTDPEWQRYRRSMLGLSAREKYDKLMWWLEDHTYPNGLVPRKTQVQITNYVTALSRGGLIKPEDYK